MIKITFDIKKVNDIVRLHSICLYNSQDLGHAMIFNPETKEFFVVIPHFRRVNPENKELNLVLKAEKHDFKSTLRKALLWAYVLETSNYLYEFAKTQYEEMDNLAIPHISIDVNSLDKKAKMLRLSEESLNQMLSFLEVFCKYNPTSLYYLYPSDIAEITFNAENCPYARNKNVIMIDSSNRLFQIEHTPENTIVCVQTCYDLEKILKQLMLYLQNKKALHEDKRKLIQRMKTELALFKKQSIFYSDSIHNLMKRAEIQEADLDATINARPMYNSKHYNNSKQALASAILSYIDRKISIIDFINPIWRVGCYDLELYQHDKTIILEYKSAKADKEVSQSLLKWFSDYALMQIFLHLWELRRST